MSTDDLQHSAELSQAQALDAVFRQERKERIDEARQRLRAAWDKRQTALNQQHEEETLREVASRDE